jgi:hypothetical protein
MASKPASATSMMTSSPYDRMPISARRATIASQLPSHRNEWNDKSRPFVWAKSAETIYFQQSREFSKNGIAIRPTFIFESDNEFRG